MTTAQVQVAKDKGWWVAQHIDTSSSWVTYTGEVTIDETNFPDEKFRNWLMEQSYGADGLITGKEISEVKEIAIKNKEVVSLKGIEYFAALKSLTCSRNKLTELDVSQNTVLKNLYCQSNQLTSLVSKNILLEELDCSNNRLTTLDVSNDTLLNHLDCSNNRLTALDVSKNKKLGKLICYSNQLTSLTLSPNSTLLTQIDCYLNSIKADEMEKLVDNLPTVTSGTLSVIDLGLYLDENVITKAQVATAKTKGWEVKDDLGDDYAGFIFGDADGDGEVTEEDVEAIRNHILGDTPEGFDLETADINGDGKVNIEDVTLLIEQLLKLALECPDSHHPHAIDLGLPSGTKWACCNVGATTPEGYGNYYAWDENMVQNTWGSKWAIPSKNQIQELIDNTTLEYTTQNGVNGFLFTASNGATLFLPAAGMYFSIQAEEPTLVGTDGSYWSSTVVDSNKTTGLSLNTNGGTGFYNYSQSAGITVRAVIK